MKIYIALLLALTLLSCKKEASLSPEDISIREVREQSNQAIARHDTVALLNAWTTDYHMITSRNSEVIGATNAVHKFADEFKVRPDVIYIRTPDTIEVFYKWNMASEQGRWTGQWTNGKEIIKVSGAYFAKWHRVNNQWLIRAEVFVPLTCEGGKFCDQSPL